VETFTVYTDASTGDEAVGVGYTISGPVDIEGSKYIYGRFTSMEGEFQALIEALRIARFHATEHDVCHVYVDVEPLIEKVDGPHPTFGIWQQRRASVEWLLSRFGSYEMHWCHRSHNTRAHDLAKAALYEARDRKI